MSSIQRLPSEPLTSFCQVAIVGRAAVALANAAAGRITASTLASGPPCLAGLWLQPRNLEDASARIDLKRPSDQRAKAEQQEYERNK